MLSMQRIIKNSKDNELVRLLDRERLKLEASVGNKISIVLNMANSPLIQRYFANLNDKDLEKMAIDEMAEYHNALKSGSIFGIFEETSGLREAIANSSIFWVNDIDKKFYFNGKYIYLLNTSDSANYWYNMTLYETEVFNFNINYNPDLKNNNLWINAPIFDDNRKPLGVLGAGIDITAFINAVYKNYKGDIGLYFFNGLGEITGARDVALITAKKKIEDQFGSVGSEIIAITKNLKPGKTQIISTAMGEIGVSAIPTFGWYALAIAPNSINDYKTAMTWLFLSMLFIMAFMLVVFNIFISKLFKPLQTTMEALKVASKAKSDFLAKMSHEIRTPMNAITGMAELALRENIPPAAQEHISAIKHAGANLLSIINDILDFSKIESGKMEIVPTSYHLSYMVYDVMSIIKLKVTDSQVKFAVDIDSEIPDALFGDEMRIRQILLNILSNAVKYTKKGSISFIVNGEIINNETILLVMEVIDTGKGIKPEDMEKLFGDFIQVDTEANKGIEGTGLGLAIAKNLAKAMGGDISVKSEYGKGSTFTVRLPQKILSFESLPEFNVTNSSLAVGFCTPKARVLVVDDIEVNLKVAEGLLAPYKMQVDSCLSGAEAIQAVKTTNYDLIFMDHMMPEMDGIEATKRIREFSNLPIIALTANAVSGTREIFLAKGFNDFISKPIDTIKLNAVLEKWIPKEKQEALKPETGDESHSNQKNRQLLAAFYKDGMQKIGEIENSLKAGDYPLYTIYVHGLKSAAANMGETDLSEFAKALENAGKNKDYAYIKQYNNIFLAALQKYLNDIGKILQTYNEEQSKNPIDIEVLKETLLKLKEALSVWDLDAIDKATDALQEFKYAPDVGEGVENILRCIFRGEYDNAVVEVENFLSYLLR